LIYDYLFWVHVVSHEKEFDMFRSLSPFVLRVLVQYVRKYRRRALDANQNVIIKIVNNCD
jgi:hypothetical protein